MPKSLADLRANPPQSLPERSLTVCLRPDLTARIQSLAVEMDNLPSPTRRDESGERTGPPPRVGAGEHPRAAEIRAEMSALLAEMAEYEGELTVRAIDDGEWRRWADAHPARDEEEPGHKRDLEVAGGYCNADDLIADLGTYAHAWNGEPLADGDWAILAASMGGADKKDAARLVVSMHESRLDFQQWRNGLSIVLNRSNDSASPETSPSPRAGSTGGSRSKSSGATTKKGSK